MEVRKAKLLANIRKTGSGGTTFRATLPSKWVREMGLDEETRMLELKFNGKEIIIQNDKEENNMLKLKENLEDKELTLLEMDNIVLDLVGGESIFDYDRSHWKDGGFSYLDKYNVLFDIVKDNENPLKVLVKITEVELI